MTNSNTKKAVVILSGGMDSVTTLAIANSEGYKCSCITFDYGQKSIAEITAAKYFSKLYKSQDHKIFEIDFRKFTKSALTSSDISIPINSNDSIPDTYVPMRNIIFLSIACSWAEMLSISNIFIGANAIDYSGYPDCREDFLESFESTVNLGSKTGNSDNKFNILRPLINLKKIQIIKIGHSLGLNYTKTISCYQATEDGKACGICESCSFRKKAFIENGLNDETIYI